MSLSLEEKKQVVWRAVQAAQFVNNEYKVASFFEKLNLPSFKTDLENTRTIVQMGYERMLLLDLDFLKAFDPKAIYCPNCNKICKYDVTLKRDIASMTSKCCKVEVFWADSIMKFAGLLAVQEDPVQFIKEYLEQAGIKFPKGWRKK